MLVHLGGRYLDKKAGGNETNYVTLVMTRYFPGISPQDIIPPITYGQLQFSMRLFNAPMVM